jgi:hypothetical protein
VDSTYTELSFLLDAAAKSGTSVYLHLEPLVWDVTDPKSEKNLAICTPDSRFTIPMSAENVPFIFSVLKRSILAENRTVIGWDLKPLFSWLKRCLKKFDLPKIRYFDLRYLEKYAGIQLEKPTGFEEAQVRAGAVTKQDNWKEATSMWQKVIKPLATNVVPALENNGFLNVDRVARVFPCYQIEAQYNGRMSCSEDFVHGVNVQTMGDDLRGKLRPLGLDEVFMYFDYSNMEVAVLQWLSQDEDLAEFMAEGRFYENLCQFLFGRESNENSRKMVKKIFLPTIYGSSAIGLANKLPCREQIAETIINRLKQQFAKSFRYVEQFQDEAAKNGFVRDRFGRRRYITEPYLARSFSIASPATAICLERLVALHNLNVSPLLMSIHDGFVVSASQKNASSVCAAVKDCLEAEPSLAPGLKLNVHCTIGRSLAGMTGL